jgi:pyrroline-5-carboxylate reductase
MELIADFGVKRKIPAKIAATLAIQTGLGAAVLAKSAKVPCAELRRMVTSKKGTTEAALKTLVRKKFGKIVQTALRAAAKRSAQLKSC